MKTSRLAEQIATEDAIERSAREAEARDNGCKGCNGNDSSEAPPIGPTYVWREPWWKRLLRCESCGGQGGWLQGFLSARKMPGEWFPRIRRTFVGAANFAGKAAEFISTVTGGFVSAATREARQEGCRECPQRIIYRSWRGSRIVESASYCGACNCGKWFMAVLFRQIGFTKFRCKLGRHADTDVRRLVQLSVGVSAPEEADAERSPADTGGHDA